MNSKTLVLCSLPVAAIGLLCLYLACLPREVRGADLNAASQKTFATPAQATGDLVNAANAHDRREFRQIFGPEFTNMLTGDQALDERHFEQLAADLSARCDAVPEGDNKMTLMIGPEKWPFPIPLIQTNGAWLFDTAAGEEEIINRQIGHDEYHAIGVCRIYVKAQRDYARQFAGAKGIAKYAQHFRSTPGKMDGLYWAGETNTASSPLSPLVAEACLEGYNWKGGKGPRPFHGYFFKILKQQGPDAPGGKMNYVHHGEMTGGFALVAYPVRWGVSGIMTFIVNQDGTVYQRSLGEKTPRICAAMKEYNPDSQWTVVQEPGITDLSGDEPADDAQR